MPYFSISASDGDTLVTEMTKEEVLADIMEGMEIDNEPRTCLSDLNKYKHCDTNSWPAGSCLIIKGEIVTPRIVVTVDTLEID